MLAGCASKRNDDAKISTAAAQSPEEIRIVRPVRDNKCAVRQNHIGFHQIVDGEPVLAAKITMAAAQADRHGLSAAATKIPLSGSMPAAEIDPTRQIKCLTR